MITVRQLATHTSGIEDAEENNIPHMELPGWKGKFWRKDPDPFTVSRDSSRVMSTPGTRYAYSNPGMAMLSYAVTAALKGTAHTDIRTLIRERIMRSIGVDDSEWSVGYGQTYMVNGLPLVANWGGGAFTARAAARIGRLMMNKGEWDGKRLVFHNQACVIRQTFEMFDLEADLFHELAQGFCEGDRGFVNGFNPEIRFTWGGRIFRDEPECLWIMEAPE